jgi:ribosomal-protein-alanine N-acetyltransferase
MRRLAGGGLVLEPQTAEHAAELFAVLDDPELYVFIDAKGPASEAALAERLHRLEGRRSPDGTEQWLNWVVRTGAGEVVGYVQATVRPGNEAEIAYVVGRRFWRRGYAANACRLMLSELRDAYGVQRIVATLDPRNSASVMLLAKLGFEFFVSGPGDDEVIYEMNLLP